jgi:hypothetical protein
LFGERLKKYPEKYEQLLREQRERMQQELVDNVAQQEAEPELEVEIVPKRIIKKTV